MDGGIWTQILSQPNNHSCHIFPRTIFPHLGAVGRHGDVYSAPRQRIFNHKNECANSLTTVIKPEATNPHPEVKALRKQLTLCQVGLRTPSSPQDKTFCKKFSPKAETTSSG